MRRRAAGFEDGGSVTFAPMPRAEPLPFRLSVPGRDTIDADGARSVSYRLEGFLHLVGDLLTVEWTGTESTQQVSFTGVKDHVDPLPVEWLEIPVDWITEVRLRGGWWRPRLELRAGRLDAFEDIPSARAASITLRIRRRDRELAGQMAVAIDRARADSADRPSPEADDVAYLDDGGR